MKPEAKIKTKGATIEALRAMGARAIERLGEATTRIKEAGRVLSSTNEQKLRDAVQAINDVLGQLGSPEDAAADATDDAATANEAKRAQTHTRQLAEAWCDAAWDASSGAQLLASLIDIMGDESDEPDQYAMLKTAFDALSQWVAAEVAEIGTPEDEVDAQLVGMPLFDYEASRRAPKQMEAVGAIVPIREGAIRSDGTAMLKIIAPGWGSSGYYSAEVLERDGPQVFKAGTKNFWDHPTLTEEVDRPERSLRDLAGQLTSDAVFDEHGAEGPGLYANAQVVSDFARAVNELAPFIGVSIRALGTAHMGEADGQSGPIIDQLIAAESVDYVTTPGAGGRVLQIFEAARRRPISDKEVDDDMKELSEAQAQLAERDREIARLREVNLLRDAREHVTSKLADVEGLPDVTRTRLIEGLTRAAAIDKDGKLDVAKLDEALELAIKSEADYLAKAVGSGSIKGFGSVSSNDEAEAEKQLAAVFSGPGFRLSESVAKDAARGRA